MKEPEVPLREACEPLRRDGAFTVGISVGTTASNCEYRGASVSKTHTGRVSANRLKVSSLEKILTILGNRGKKPPNRFLLLRRQVLYPPELRARVEVLIDFKTLQSLSSPAKTLSGSEEHAGGKARPGSHAIGTNRHAVFSIKERLVHRARDCAQLVCSCTRPGWRIARGERLFTSFIHFIVGLFFWLAGIWRSPLFRRLFRLGTVRFTHKNRIAGLAKGFGSPNGATNAQRYPPARIGCGILESTVSMYNFVRLRFLVGCAVAASILDLRGLLLRAPSANIPATSTRTSRFPPTGRCSRRMDVRAP